ncbi:MAG TPA: FAD/NAD(P)-binding oxidoreductase, partial [Acidimicrobiales bacterium]|nr:FAD/NAD(P)-binding oxidoreductase [Acidimicrobiales bacterium]
PPAPNETAFMLHDHLVQAGARGDVTIHLVSPLPMPIPVSKETSAAIVAMLEERGILYSPKTMVTALDPETKVAHLDDGREIAFDLFLAIPVHCAPQVLVDSGLTDDGWMAVDPSDFSTRFPGIYAIGDVTSAPVPRAGVIAEGEARAAADAIIASVRGTAMPAGYDGRGVCYIESGDRMIAKVEMSFFDEGGPKGEFHPPSVELTKEKHEFGASRRRRWFGYPE